MCAEPLNVIQNSSNSQYDHKMSVNALLKSERIYLLYTSGTGYALTAYNMVMGLITKFYAILTAHELKFCNRIGNLRYSV